jgi:hypothetical protein
VLAWLALLALMLTVALAGAATAAGTASTASVSGPLVITVWAQGVPAGALPGPSVTEGAEVAWAYEVTNTGPVALWALYLWHNGVGPPACPDRSLAPGETVRCTAAQVAVAGAHAVSVQAWAWDDAGAAASAEATACYTGTGPVVAPAPAIDLEAFVAGQDADVPPGPVVAPGQSVVFRFRVRNTGNVVLWGLWVRDRALGTITCPQRTLAPGERVICTARATAEAGLHAFAAEASAVDAVGTAVTDGDLLHYFGAPPTPGVDLEALVEGFDGDSPPGPRVRRPGEEILFTYVVTNTGGVPLTRIRVTDSARGEVTCPARTLAPGTSMTCTGSVVASLGRFHSTARVTARAGTAVARDSDPIYYHVREEPRLHKLTLEVTVNGRDADDPPGPSIAVGRPVRFAYVITYTGNNIVYNVTIQDPFVAESLLSCDGDRTLSAGDTLVCEATVAAGAGQYATAVTAVSWDADGRRVSAEDRAHYYGMA